MKLREFNFNALRPMGMLGLVVFDGDKRYEGFIGEVLRQIPHLAEREIESTNTYFNEFVIRLRGSEVQT